MGDSKKNAGWNLWRNSQISLKIIIARSSRAIPGGMGKESLEEFLEKSLEECIEESPKEFQSLKELLAGASRDIL